MHKTAALALLMVFLGVSSPVQAEPFEPTLVIRGLRTIRTGSRSAGQALQQGADLAVAITQTGTDATISEIGNASDLLKRCAPAHCKAIDAHGGSLLPGLHDAHAHETSAGASNDRVQVSGSSIPSIQSAVRSFAAANPGHPWILGRGWDAAGFGTQFPSARDLDQAESARPVALIDSDGHQVWANTAAIREAGITRETPDPEGGTILRDGDGNPNGVFLETAADLLWNAIPDPSVEQIRKYILNGQAEALAAGFTSHHGGPVGLRTMETYAALDRENLLKQRSYLWADLDADDETFSKILAFDHNLPAEGRVHVSAFKGFVDGVISSYTGALVDPYTDAPETRGKATYSQEDLNARVLRANAAGYPVALHAIGDMAVRMALNAFENSKTILGHDLINRIEHIELVHPFDVPRFAKLNVAASMQPTHMHFGSESSSYYDDRLGRDRLAHAFAWGELERAGALLLFGTDTPVVPQDSVEALHCAVVRTYGNGKEFEPQNRVSETSAVAAFSSDAQLSLHSLRDARVSGAIVPGGVADLVVFPKDPFQSKARSLGELSPSLILIDGEVVLQNSR